ncbi:hypothetical protein Btru_009948 [Bulinus truncatus]|nr:hypothetical protein Btru_009948 [Bulinus truncatus]
MVGYSRFREILATCLLVTVSLLHGATLPDPGVCEKNLDIAIVGAGPGGSYAAYRLRHENLKIEMFEYFDRIGGRLFTASLPNTPDIPLDMGGMRFVREVHPTVFKVVKELGLTYGPFNEIRSNTSDSRFYLRGQSLTLQDLFNGTIPFQLSDEEKANQGRLIRFYLEKLTGFNGLDLTEDILYRLRVPDGRYLYELPLRESLQGISTKDGRELAKALSKFESLLDPDCPLCLWEGEFTFAKVVQTVHGGMGSIPKNLIRNFLEASNSHKLNTNRRLLSISGNRSDGYQLVFQHTQTVDGLTSELPTTEVVCAKKVVLAIPRFALTRIDWSPLSDESVVKALNSVRMAKANKIFLTFRTPWWRENSTNVANVTYSDLHFSQFFDWGRSQVSGDYIMLASYADDSKTEFLASLNSVGPAIKGSAPGSNNVSQTLLDTLLDELSLAYGVNRGDISEPVTAFSQFWMNYPFGGSWVVWKAGYRYEDVISVVQRPSPTDDVFYVGSDNARSHIVTWSEGALQSVDRMLRLYFSTQ